MVTDADTIPVCRFNFGGSDHAFCGIYYNISANWGIAPPNFKTIKSIGIRYSTIFFFKIISVLG